MRDAYGCDDTPEGDTGAIGGPGLPLVEGDDEPAGVPENVGEIE